MLKKVGLSEKEINFDFLQHRELRSPIVKKVKQSRREFS